MDDDVDHKRATARSFGDATDAYLVSDVHGRGADLELLASWCAGATRALDVASAVGHTAGAVADEGVVDVIAADASPSMVETCESTLEGVSGVVADAEQLPFPDASFDAVTCRIAAHHFPDPPAFVAEVARVLRPGGTFAFEDNVAPEDETLGEFINRVERLRDPTHVRSHTTARWREWFEDAGLSVEDVERVTKTLEFDSWVATQSLPAERADRVARLLADAPTEATERFGIESTDGAVRSFVSPKALIRSTRLR